MNPGEVENRPTKHDVYCVAIDAGRSVLVALAKWGAIAYGGYCAWQAIASLAGKETDATIALFINALEKKTDYSCFVFLLIGILGVVYGKVQNMTKERTVERLHPRIKELETLLDRQRTSSNLLPNGRTNPKDE